MKCPAVMLGYHNRPDVAPPLTPDGFYITGDVFRRDADGFHYFVGRTDDMFVSGGENIYPADVERMLERHPDVAQAAVVPIDDDIKGQKPVAFVIAKPGRALDGEASQALRARQCAGLPASALRLVRRRTAARLDQQDRPRGAARWQECAELTTFPGRSAAERSEMVRCRPGIVANSEPATIPDQQCTSAPSALRLTDPGSHLCRRAFTVFPGHLHRSAMMHFSHSGRRAMQV